MYMPRHASRVFYSIWPRHPIESSICFWEPRHREPHRGLGISTRSLLRRAFLKVFAQVVSGTADRRDPSYGCQEQHALRTLLPMSGHVGIRVGMVHRQGRHHEAQIWTCCVCNLLPNPKRHAWGCFWRSLLGDAGNGREGSSVAGAEAVGFALPRMVTLSFRTKAVCRCTSATIEKYSHMPIHVPAAKPSCLRV